MIVKSYKDDQFELIMQLDEAKNLYSVSLFVNAVPKEFQGRLDFETANDVYEYYWDKIMGNDLKTWEGFVE